MLITLLAWVGGGTCKWRLFYKVFENMAVPFFLEFLVLRYKNNGLVRGVIVFKWCVVFFVECCVLRLALCL